MVVDDLELFEGFLVFSGSCTMAGLAILIWIVIRLLRNSSSIFSLLRDLGKEVEDKSDGHS